MIRWQRILLILWCVQFLTTMTTSLGLTFVPFFLQQDPAFQITDKKQLLMYTSLILSAPLVTTLLSSPLWGWLADRMGHKQQVLRAILGIGITQCLMGFAQSPEQLIMIRLLQGAIAGVMTANLSLLASIVPKEEKGRAISTFQSSRPAGTIFGPVVGGILASVFGFRPVYWCFGGLLLVCCLLVAWFLQTGTSHTADRREESLPGDNSPQAMQYRLISPEPEQRAGFLTETRRSMIAVYENPGLWISFWVLGLGQIAWSCTSVVFAIFVGKLVLVWLEAQPWMTSWWNQGVVFVSICMTVTGIFHLILSLWWGKWLDQQKKFLTFSATIILAISISVLIFWPPLWLVLLIRVGMGIGLGGTSNLQYARISRESKKDMHGKVIGLATSVANLGALLGLLLGGYLSQLWGETGNFMLTGVLYLCLGLFSMYQDLRCFSIK